MQVLSKMADTVLAICRVFC